MSGSAATKPSWPAELAPLSPAERIVAVMKRLRAPEGGCPWDLKQDHVSLKPYLIEEAYEVIAAIDEGRDPKLCEELGDLLLQIVFHAEVARQRHAFDFDDVADAISAKLIGRHPHIFGDVQVDSAEEVLQNWEQIKLDEGAKKGRRKSILGGVPEGLPSLLKAYRIQEKVSSVGFDWNEAAEVAPKVREECDEFLEALAAGDRAEMEAELGDLLYSLVNLGRHLGLNAEFCLQKCNATFVRRFQDMENQAHDEGRPLAGRSLEELDVLWERAKARGADMAEDACPRSTPKRH